MARPATGTIIEPKGDRQPSYAIRFNAYGKRRFVTLGTPEDGWTREKAEQRLRHVLADVERGIWTPPAPAAIPDPNEDPTFHEFAAEWLRSIEPDLRPRTIGDYRWTLSYHLLPFFAEHRLSQITRAEVDRYRVEKQHEGERRAAAIAEGDPLRDDEGRILRPLGANAINKTISRLAQILDLAVDHNKMASNPAKGRRRRAKGTEPKRTHVEVEQLMALLDAADEFTRPLLATLAGAGLRIGEACALDWCDVNLSAGTLTVQISKTPAGEDRVVDLHPGLAEDLRTWKAASPMIEDDDPVFLRRDRWTGEVSRQTGRRARSGMDIAIKAANVTLEAEGIDPIRRASPHSLRRSFASLNCAARQDMVYVAEQGGWTDPTFVIRVYAKAAKRRDRLTGAHLRAYDRTLEWAGVSAGSVRGPSIDAADLDYVPSLAPPQSKP